MTGKNGGRAAQRARTRREILQAARRLLERGEKPGFDEVAAEAGVSRATAYRYFPGLEALLDEAAVDALVPEPEALFGDGAPEDVPARLMLVDDIFDQASRTREPALRLMLSRILERSAMGGRTDAPLRQNRRGPMLERALDPLNGTLDPSRRGRLVNALAMIVGAEGMIALKDVVGIDEDEARAVRRWAIEALLAAALRESRPAG